MQKLQDTRLNVFTLLALLFDLFWYFVDETVLNGLFQSVCLFAAIEIECVDTVAEVWQVHLKGLFQVAHLLEPLLALVNYVLSQALAPVIDHRWQLALEILALGALFCKVLFHFVFHHAYLLLPHFL